MAFLTSGPHGWPEAYPRSETCVVAVRARNTQSNVQLYDKQRVPAENVTLRLTFDLIIPSQPPSVTASEMLTEQGPEHYATSSSRCDLESHRPMSLKHRHPPSKLFHTGCVTRQRNQARCPTVCESRPITPVARATTERRRTCRRQPEVHCWRTAPGGSDAERSWRFNSGRRLCG